MARNKSKQRFMAMPVEKHNTAAWADIEKRKPVSNVTQPSEMQVRDAKDYVDANQK